MKPYLDRNLDIVLASDALAAAPDGPEKLRSRTGTTLRTAIAARRKGFVVLPSGVRVVNAP